MVVVLAFAAGYFLGARGGRQELDDLVEAARALRQSEEFGDLMSALRAHAASTLRELAGLLERAGIDTDDLPSMSTQDLVDRVKSLVGRESATGH